ncbi:hypothetical protein C9374_003906 [Naegleria lovaniensis]|uniref:non-specific serine/threonine protein kinase n=1 Tax=Naegleria lovaniensis TaxID=51637 RepID=A0AA88H8R8_NAELO|nr:uncharacterized protein C9374_003906 [Naegleria lovaniensis]KAG2394142.1 hypothetical protein C9374_003906 [Naegleria lovaniensis]
MSHYVWNRFSLYFQIVSSFMKINSRNDEKIQEIKKKLLIQQEILNEMKEKQQHETSQEAIELYNIEIEKIEERLNRQMSILQQYEDEVRNMQDTTLDLSCKFIFQFIMIISVVVMLFYLYFSCLLIQNFVYSQQQQQQQISYLPQWKLSQPNIQSCQSVQSDESGGSLFLGGKFTSNIQFNSPSTAQLSTTLQSEAYLLRVTANGTVNWTYQIPSTVINSQIIPNLQSTEVVSIRSLQDTGSQYVAVGVINNNEGLFIVKFSSNAGSSVVVDWTKVIRGDYLNVQDVTFSSSNIVVVGSFKGVVTVSDSLKLGGSANGNGTNTPPITSLPENLYVLTFDPSSGNPQNAMTNVIDNTNDANVKIIPKSVYFDSFANECYVIGTFVAAVNYRITFNRSPTGGNDTNTVTIQSTGSGNDMFAFKYSFTSNGVSWITTVGGIDGNEDGISVYLNNNQLLVLGKSTSKQAITFDTQNRFTNTVSSSEWSYLILYTSSTGGVSQVIPIGRDDSNAVLRANDLIVKNNVLTIGASFKGSVTLPGGSTISATSMNLVFLQFPATSLNSVSQYVTYASSQDSTMNGFSVVRNQEIDVFYAGGSLNGGESFMTYLIPVYNFTFEVDSPKSLLALDASSGDITTTINLKLLNKPATINSDPNMVFIYPGRTQYPLTTSDTLYSVANVKITKDMASAGKVGVEVWNFANQYLAIFATYTNLSIPFISKQSFDLVDHASVVNQQNLILTQVVLNNPNLDIQNVYINISNVMSPLQKDASGKVFAPLSTSSTTPKGIQSVNMALQQGPNSYVNMSLNAINVYFFDPTNSPLILSPIQTTTVLVYNNSENNVGKFWNFTLDFGNELNNPVILQSYVSPNKLCCRYNGAVYPVSITKPTSIFTCSVPISNAEVANLRLNLCYQFNATYAFDISTQVQSNIITFEKKQLVFANSVPSSLNLDVIDKQYSSQPTFPFTNLFLDEWSRINRNNLPFVQLDLKIQQQYPQTNLVYNPISSIATGTFQLSSVNMPNIPTNNVVAPFTNVTLSLTFNKTTELTNNITIYYLRYNEFAGFQNFLAANGSISVVMNMKYEIPTSFLPFIFCIFNNRNLDLVPVTKINNNNLTEFTCHYNNPEPLQNSTIQLVLSYNKMPTGGKALTDNVSLRGSVGGLPRVQFLIDQTVSVAGINQVIMARITTPSPQLITLLTNNIWVDLNGVKYFARPDQLTDGLFYIPLISNSVGWKDLTIYTNVNSGKFELLGTQPLKIFFFDPLAQIQASYSNGSTVVYSPQQPTLPSFDVTIQGFEIPYSQIFPRTVYCNVFGANYPAVFSSNTSLKCTGISLLKEGDVDIYLTYGVNTTFSVNISKRTSLSIISKKSITFGGNEFEYSALKVNNQSDTNSVIVQSIPWNISVYNFAVAMEESLFKTFPTLESADNFNIKIRDGDTALQYFNSPLIIKTTKLSRPLIYGQVNLPLNRNLLRLNVSLVLKNAPYDDLSVAPLSIVLFRQSFLSCQSQRVISSGALLVNTQKPFSQPSGIVSSTEQLLLDRLYCQFYDEGNLNLLLVRATSMNGATSALTCSAPSIDWNSTLRKFARIVLNASPDTVTSVVASTLVINNSTTDAQVYPMYCNTIPHYTTSTVCSGRGVCIQTNTCSCQKNYLGDNCEKTTCFGVLSTDPLSCSGQGQCTLFNTCVCRDGSYGTMCENQILFASKDKTILTSNRNLANTLSHAQFYSYVVNSGSEVTKLPCNDIFPTTSLPLIGESSCFINQQKDFILYTPNTWIKNDTVIPAFNNVRYYVLDPDGVPKLDSETNIVTSTAVLTPTSASFPVVLQATSKNLSPLSTLEYRWSADQNTELSNFLSAYTNQMIVKIPVTKLNRRLRSLRQQLSAIPFTLNVIDLTFNTSTTVKMPYQPQLSTSSSPTSVLVYGKNQITCSLMDTCFVELNEAPLKSSIIDYSVEGANNNLKFNTSFQHSFKASRIFSRSRNDIQNNDAHCIIASSQRSSSNTKTAICVRFFSPRPTEYYVESKRDGLSNKYALRLVRFNPITQTVEYPTLDSTSSILWKCFYSTDNVNRQSCDSLLQRNTVDNVVYGLSGSSELTNAVIQLSASINGTNANGVKFSNTNSIHVELLSVVPHIVGFGYGKGLPLTAAVTSFKPISSISFSIWKNGTSKVVNNKLFTTNYQSPDMKFISSVLDISQLNTGARYTIRFEAKTSDQQVAFVERQFSMQLEPPTPRCGISPKEGIAFETEFTISCFSDSSYEDGNIAQYGFYLSNDTSEIALSVSTKKSFFTRLPYMENPKLKIVIRDVWNGFTTMTLPVKLTNPLEKSTPDALISSLLNEDASQQSIGLDIENSYYAAASSLPDISKYSQVFLPKLSAFVQHAKESEIYSMDKVLKMVDSIISSSKNVLSDSSNVDYLLNILDNALSVRVLRNSHSTSSDYVKDSEISTISKLLDLLLPLVSPKIQYQFLIKYKQGLFKESLSDELWRNPLLVSTRTLLPSMTSTTSRFNNYLVLKNNLYGDEAFKNSSYLSIPSEGININLASLFDTNTNTSSFSLYEVELILQKQTTKTRSLLLASLTTAQILHFNVRKNGQGPVSILNSNAPLVNITFDIALSTLPTNYRPQCKLFSSYDQVQSNQDQNLTTLHVAGTNQVTCSIKISDLGSGSIYVTSIPLNIPQPPPPSLSGDNTLLIVILCTVLAGSCVIGVCMLIMCIFGVRIVLKRRRENATGRGASAVSSPTGYAYKPAMQTSPTTVSDQTTTSSSDDKIEVDTSSTENHNDRTVVHYGTSAQEKPHHLHSLLNGQYQLLEYISGDEFENIYKANDLVNNQIVAIKRVNFITFDESNSAREYSNLSKVNHPHVTRLYETFIDTDDKAICMVLDYCPFGDLKRLLESRRENGSRFEQWEVVEILKQISQALACIHDQHNLCHTAVKLSNIFIKEISHEKMIVCLGEFGNSRSRHSLNLTLAKSPEDPESFKPSSSLNDRFGNFATAFRQSTSSYSDTFTSTDIFDFGVCLYQLLTMDTSLNIVKLHEEAEYESEFFKTLKSIIEKQGFEYDHELIAIVLSMLALDVKKRPTASKVIQMVDNAQIGKSMTL